MAPPSSPNSIAVIGDLIASRRYPVERRALVQERLAIALDQINAQFSGGILSDFLITAGDEFQGLLADGTILPELIWDLEAVLRGVEFRLGIGCGMISTPLKERAVGMDGPAWYMARDAVQLAAAEGRNGGVFVGFGASQDRVLNGIARLLRHLREGWTSKQFEVVAILRSGKQQVEVAELLGVSRQAISKHAKSAGWDVYLEGEDAWRMALAPFDFNDSWQRP